MAAYRVTCMLTAKNRDQLRNPTLGNRVWASFTFLSAVKKRRAVSLRHLSCLLLQNSYTGYLRGSSKRLLKQSRVQGGPGLPPREGLPPNCLHLISRYDRCLRDYDLVVAHC